MGGLKQYHSLKTAREFQAVYKHGRYTHTPFFVLYFLKDSNNFLSVVASKKVGNAVKRNRAKRRLRALFLESLGANAFSHQSGRYVLVAKQPIVEETYSNLYVEFTKAIKRISGKKR